MDKESLIIKAILAFFTVLLVDSITDQTPQEFAYSTAKSVFLSPTPIEAIATVTVYGYGFSCHYATTSEAYKAFRNNDSKAVFTAEEKNRYCFSDAAKMAGIRK